MLSFTEYSGVWRWRIRGTLWPVYSQYLVPTLMRFALLVGIADRNEIAAATAAIKFYYRKYNNNCRFAKIELRVNTFYTVIFILDEIVCYFAPHFNIIMY